MRITKDMKLITAHSQLVKDPKKIKAIPKRMSVANLKDLETMLTEHMVKAKGIGLAGPQIGYNFKIAVIDSLYSEHTLIINPKYKAVEGTEYYENVEGCLSVDREAGYAVRRPNFIEVSYETLIGDRRQSVSRILSGVKAMVFMHEADHLNAVTIKELGYKYKK